MPRLTGRTENGRLETGAKNRVPLRGALSLICRMSNIFSSIFLLLLKEMGSITDITLQKTNVTP